MKALILVLLAVIFLASVLLDKMRRTLSVVELRRRARDANNKGTLRIYKLVAQGDSLKLFLWLVGGISGSVLFIKIADLSIYTGVFIMLLASWLVLNNRPLNTQGILWKLAGFISWPTLKIVDFLHPVLARIAMLVNKHRPTDSNGGIYNKEDLLQLIDSLLRQKTNHIPPEDLKIAHAALTFGSKTVASAMTPRRKIKFVAATDTIGPLLMDELHSSGLNQFPVVQSSANKDNRNVIGTLYLNDLLSYGDKGRVRDIMKKEVCTIAETKSLRDALDLCLKNNQNLLLVTNNFEEIAGMISQPDIMEQILGNQKEPVGHKEPKVVK